MKTPGKNPLAAALPLALGGATLAAAEIARRRYRDARLFCPSPEPENTWDPADYGIDRDSVERLRIPAGGRMTLDAWYCRAEHPRASGIFCHGNTGNLTTSADIVPHLIRAGLSILLFDYRGYGRSDGRASAGGIVRDGLAAARFHERLRPRELPSILYGFSLGGAVAAQVVRKHRFDGLILQSTFTSLEEITRVLHPTVPLHLLARGVFETIETVRGLDVPLLVLHGEDDEVAPCSMAHELAAACGTRKAIRVVPRGRHKDLYTREPELLTAEITKFLRTVEEESRRTSAKP
jgi:alpha-beta hydrolase superfamily lysophospholipase